MDERQQDNNDKDNRSLVIKEDISKHYQIVKGISDAEILRQLENDRKMIDSLLAVAEGHSRKIECLTGELGRLADLLRLLCADNCTTEKKINDLEARMKETDSRIQFLEELH